MSLSEDLYLPETAKALGITLRHLVTNLTHQDQMPTICYPDVKRPLNSPERYRGRHRLLKREDGTPRCVACMLCATACPAVCIHIVAEESPTKTIEKRPMKFEIDMLRCVFCGLCVEACPCDAIRMDTGKYEMADYSRKSMIFDMDMLLNH